MADAAPTMRIKVYSPFKGYYDDDAESISAINETGPFDILPHHKNFMTLLQTGDIVIRRTGTEDVKIPISRGIMYVKTDKVTVFLDV